MINHVVYWIGFGSMLIASVAQGQAVCTPTPKTMSYDFSNPLNEDPMTTASGWSTVTPKKLTLPKLTSIGGRSGTLGARVAAIATGNFDGGSPAYDDIIALVQDAPNNICSIQFFRNLGMSGGGTHLGFDVGVTLTGLSLSQCTEEGIVLRAGDINGDGKIDLMLALGEDIHGEGAPRVAGSGKRALRVFKNTTPLFPSGATPQFEAESETLQESMGLFDVGYPRWHWASDAMQLVNWNSGTDPGEDQLHDLIVTDSGDATQRIHLFFGCDGTPPCNNSTKSDFGFDSGVVLIDNVVFSPTKPVANAGNPVSMPPGNSNCPPSRQRGISVVIAEDFDMDGDRDLIVGSMNYKGLLYYANDGSSVVAPTFAGPVPIAFTQGGVTYAAASDIDGDGDLDLTLGIDRYACKTTNADGAIWQMTNSGMGTFAAPRKIADLGNDVDWIVTLDVDGDGRRDVMAGLNVENSPYYLGLPAATGKYALQATAVSVGDALFDPTQQMIVQALFRIANVSVGASDTLTYYVSNNDGKTWELITPSELPSALSQVPHDFTSFGSTFRWKAEIVAGPNPIGGSSTTVTPVINEIEFDYYYTPAQITFSRSGLSYGKIGADEYFYSAFSKFPTFEATVKAYRITGCDLATKRVDECPVAWDAGNRLQSSTGASRTLFTAWDNTGTGGVINDRLPSTGGITTPPGADPILGAILATSDDDDWLFFRNGLHITDTSQWKLYDIGHSTPVFVGAPQGNESFMDPLGTRHYDTFKSSQASRAPRVYIGSNAGLIHSFDATNGNEVWGFLPHNLAAKAMKQRGTGDQYEHGYHVDGPVVVRDVFNATTNEWKTILIAGEARGYGRGVNASPKENYYVALDITDASPGGAKPLWEFGDPWDNYGGSCDGNSCEDDPGASAACATPVCQSICKRAVSLAQNQDWDSGSSKVEIDPADFASFPQSASVVWINGKPEDVESYPSVSAPDTIQFPGGSLDIKQKEDDPFVVIEPGPTYVFQEHTSSMGHQQIVIESEHFHTVDYFDDSAGQNDQWKYKFKDNGDWSNDVYMESKNSNCGDTGNDWPLSNPPTCGSMLSFTLRFDTTGLWDVYFYAELRDDDDHLYWGIDGGQLQELHHDNSGDPEWFRSTNGHGDNEPTGSVRLNISALGLHEFRVLQGSKKMKLDKIVLVKQGGNAPSGKGPTEICEEVCEPVSCGGAAVPQVNCGLSNSVPWPECGGMPPDKTCCTDPDNPNSHYCAPPGTCGDPESVLGETLSPPSVGRFRVMGQERWLMITASGYNNLGYHNTGRSVYAVDVFTGATVGRWDLGNIPGLPDVDNVVPGGTVLVDLDNCATSPVPAGCGFVDRIYVGDREGRLWKIDTATDGNLGAGGLVSYSDWPSCVVFDAGQPTGSGTRQWAPIITTPAVAILGNNVRYPNIYFGTGGDDLADPNILYRFYSIYDSDPGACSTSTLTEADLGANDNEFIIGDHKKNDKTPASAGAPLTNADDEGVVGDRYWSDPIIINGFLFFVSLNGKIDSVNPCSAIDGKSSFAYVVQLKGTKSGTIWKRLEIKNKVRTGATVRGFFDGGTFSSYATGVAGSHTTSSAPTPANTQVFVQGATDTTGAAGNAEVPCLVGCTDVLPNVTSTQNPFKVIRWREIPL